MNVQALLILTVVLLALNLAISIWAFLSEARRRDRIEADLMDRLMAKDLLEYKRGNSVPSASQRIRQMEVENDLALSAAKVMAGQPGPDSDLQIPIM